MAKRNIITFFSPVLSEPDRLPDSIVVIIDVLRATSAICTAFHNGVRSIIPVAEAHEAKAYKDKGYLVAAERDGFILDFADFGNSPFNFTREKVEGRTIVYSTTNGTGLINLASGASYIVIGSFLNISALVKWILNKEGDVVLFCAGWKNRFNIEDTVCAGAIAARLINSYSFTTVCDSTAAAMDLWSLAENNISGYIDKAAQRTRLREKGLDDCIPYCLTPDLTDKVPILNNGIFVNNI